MATINTINNTKNAVEIYTEIKANGTKIEYITVDNQRIGILGSVSETDREKALKVLNDTYIASNGNIYEMMQKLMTIATIDEKEIEPDEMVNICGTDIMISYAKRAAYTMDGEEIANCTDLPPVSNDVIKALLTARIEAILK